MLHLGNDDVARLLRMPEAVDAMRTAYREYARGEAALVPRVDLWAPCEREDGYYCLGTMAGTSLSGGVTALRVKSDVTYWPGGETQEKYAKAPGRYCGFVLVFDNGNGAPLALINDGVLQHVRVGAAAGVALDVVSSPSVRSLGILGSGGMARSMLEAALVVRDFEAVRVFSPTARHRDGFVRELADRHRQVEVTAVDDAAAAVADADVVISATDSMVPTIDPLDTAPHAVVVTVSRREIARRDYSAFQQVLQLGRHSFPPSAEMPEMQYPQSGMAGFVAGSEEQRKRLPWGRYARREDLPSIIDVLAGRHDLGEGRGRLLVVNTGTQGVQFAAMSALVLRRAREEHVGLALDQEMFLQDIRD